MNQERGAIRGFLQKLRTPPAIADSISKAELNTIAAFVRRTQRSLLVTVENLSLQSGMSDVGLRWQTAGREHSTTVKAQIQIAHDGRANVTLQEWPRELRAIGLLAFRCRIPQFEAIHQSLTCIHLPEEADDRPADKPARLAASTQPDEGVGSDQSWHEPTGSVSWPTGQRPLVSIPGGNDDGPFQAVLQITWGGVIDYRSRAR